jgi:hypothetical protein
MTREEQIAVDGMRSRGWTVLTKGWPDIFAFRKTPNGKIENSILEIKAGKDRVKKHQKEMHDALRDTGLNVSVLRLNPNKGRRKT